MTLRQPRSTRTDTLLPYTTPCRSLDEADDRAAASARLARAAIDAPVLREIAEVAFGAEEIAQGRAARGDRRRQHVLDRGHERREFRPGHFGRSPRRRALRHVERPADIEDRKSVG